jgi:uncharacterized protein (TIGR02453 family)
VAGSYFSPALFAFLRELKANNRREWFADNKARFIRDVETPVLEFITDLGPRLAAVNPRFLAKPTRGGGSMFRIYRDTRFSEDKTPFKTWVSARFPHRDAGRDVSAPGFYLHLEPGKSLGGGGVYHPDTASLRRIRERIATVPKEWAAVVRRGLEIDGDTLQRVPAGFPPNHRFVADLKRTDHYVMRTFSARTVSGRDFLDVYTAECERVAPLLAFLTKALGLRW